MAYAEKLPSGKWRGCYRGPDKKKRYVPQTWDTMKQARERAQDEEAKIRAGTWVDPLKARRLMRDWVPEWEGGRILEVTTADTDRRIAQKHILGTWGDREIGSIGHQELQKWIAGLTKDGLSPWTVLGIASQMKACMSAALRDKLIGSNPCEGLKLPSPPPARDVVYSQAETDLIVPLVVDEADRVVYRTLEWTGMRFGEVAGMHVAQVLMTKRVFQVRRAYVERNGTKQMKPYPKGAEMRDVPIPDRLVPILEKHLEGLAPVDSCSIEHRKGDDCPGGLLFRHGYGGVLGRRQTLRTWSEARKLADEKNRADGGPGVQKGTVHDLRHTYASRLAAGGLPLSDLKDIMGHKSLRTTERYIHHMPDQHKRARDVLNGL